MRPSLITRLVPPCLVLAACTGTLDDNARGDTGALPTTPREDASIFPVVSPSSGDAGPRESVDAGTPTQAEDAATRAVEDAAGAIPGLGGCEAGPGLTEGEHSFVLEGLERRFVIRLPNGYAQDRRWPLVLALHGNGGSIDTWDGTGGSRDIRSVLSDHAVLVVTEAIEGQWRDYDAPRESWPARIESELLYFDHIISQVRQELCIAPDAIFSMGFSGGGSFSGVLGCRRTDIRAIAVGGSVIYFDPDDCVGTPAAWITIGTEELTTGREAYRDYFRERASCDASASPTAPDPCMAYAGCSEGTPVHYCQHPDGHIWPSFASQAMWDFFSRFVPEPP